ncbi:MAG: Asp/Glu racemase [Gammaproteobacteria bacterium]|nr:Asp/Glu racemase [Gammaproteobacteria bacterium]
MIRSEIINKPPHFDQIAALGRIGLIALATDFNSEQDLRRMLPAGVEIFTNRVLNANPVTMQNLRNMAADINRTAGGILPGIKLDAVIYGCTSGTVANGVDNIERLIQQSNPGVPVTNPVTAALKAFELFSAKRISILTPYTRDINDDMADYFEQQGITVLNIAGFGCDNDLDMTNISPTAIADAANHVYQNDADLLFISCTALRASLVIEQIEKNINKPVVTSNQALVWHSLKLISYSGKVPGYGRLLQGV